MTAMFDSALGWILRLVVGGAVVIYAGLVLMTFATDGPRYRPRLRLADPLRSLERLLVWLGVKALMLLMAWARAALAVLSEASAEVGEWFMSQRGPRSQATFRSHFL